MTTDDEVEVIAEALAIAHYEDEDVWRSGSLLSDVARRRWRAKASRVANGMEGEE